MRATPEGAPLAFWAKGRPGLTLNPNPNTGLVPASLLSSTFSPILIFSSAEVLFLAFGSWRNFRNMYTYAFTPYKTRLFPGRALLVRVLLCYI